MSIYGENFPKPTMEEFGLTNEEFQKLSRFFKKHKKVIEYQNAVKIYYKIQQEKRNSLEDWF